MKNLLIVLLVILTACSTNNPTDVQEFLDNSDVLPPIETEETANHKIIDNMTESLKKNKKGFKDIIINPQDEEEPGYANNTIEYKLPESFTETELYLFEIIEKITFFAPAEYLVEEPKVIDMRTMSGLLSDYYIPIEEIPEIHEEYKEEWGTIIKKSDVIKCYNDYFSKNLKDFSFMWSVNNHNEEYFFPDSSVEVDYIPFVRSHNSTDEFIEIDVSTFWCYSEIPTPLYKLNSSEEIGIYNNGNFLFYKDRLYELPIIKYTFIPEDGKWKIYSIEEVENLQSK